MKKLILVLVFIATLAVPSVLVAGTSWFISGSNNGTQIGFSVRGHGGSSYRETTRTTVIRERVNVHRHYRGCNHRGYKRQMYAGQNRNRIHRQEGRRYVNERYYSERIVVVPSGSSTYYYSNRY